jgi:gliding motility-associated-like protein
MIRNLLFLFLFSFCASFSFTQCITADPFCTGTTYNFQNSTNVTNLGAVDCLGSTPNPSWYYLEIDANGTMNFNISQVNTSGTGIDVDFAIWGPFSSLNAACAGANPFPAGSGTVDCSYSTAAVETASIPNAQVGQVYVVLLTNFANQPGTITFNQTGGSGSADCSFTCGVNLTANPSACSNNTYNLSGNLTVTGGPGISVPNSGTVTITNSCGGSQTFSAPFTNIPYNFPGLAANGAACTVTASFSGFPNCNTVQAYTAPPSCVTPCAISSVTAVTTACSNGTYSVGGSISFTNAPTTGTLTVTGSCGGTQTFNAPFTSPLAYNFAGLTANGAACTVTATFSANAACTFTQNYSAPVACNCSITAVTATPTACVNSLFTLNGSVTFTNPPTTGTLTITNSCGGSQTFNAPFTSPQAYSLTGLNANGAACSVTATFSATPSCTLSQNFTAPASCNCAITAISATPTACSANQYTLSGNITFANAPASGTMTVTSSCGGTQTFNAPFTSPQAYSLAGLTANGAACTVTASFSANAACTLTQNFTAPASCNCAITAISATPTACSANQYTLSGNITFANAPASGTITVTSSCGGTQTFNAPFSSPQAYSLAGLTANGAACTVTASFSGNAACTLTQNFIAPASCNCSMTTLTAVPTACSNNLYNVSGSLSFLNAPTTGTLTISSPCGGNLVVNAPFTSPQAYTFPNLNANGSTCTVTAVFSANAACTLSQNFNAPAACTTPGCVQDPFCTGTTITYPAGTNQTDASITYPNNNYDCLFSSPNPAWFYFQIASGGSLGIDMTNSSGVDIDYVLYGPYTDLANANANCNNMGNGAATNTVIDCSFSGAASETAFITNAQPGDVYVLLITNFSNSATNISFTNNNSGSATTDCSIVTPVCNFTGFTGTVSSCNGITNQYTLTGTISYVDAPTTGTLTLTNSCGGTQTFNAPFGTSQNYSFSGSSNGAACVISASFSADASCSATLNYSAPPSCTCPAEVGTYVTSVTGNSNALTMLCYGDQIDITSNNNWTPPSEILGATDPLSPNYDPNAPSYDPGIAWLVYSCPPTVSLNPAMSTATGLSIPDDPCLQGVVGITPNFSDPNDLSLINAFPAGTFTNNTVYLVPITMYSLVDGIYSYVILPADPCFELGTPIAVQYLPQVTFTQTQNCANGTVSATISGGASQLNGTNFTVVASSVTPVTATVVNSTTSNGGTIILGNLSSGPYSFNIEDANGCPVTISGTYTGAQTASLNYLDDLYCLNDPNPSAQISGTVGGTFTSGPGLTINATTGLIDLISSTPGVYTITYTTPGPLCPGSDSYSITIEDYPIIDGGPDLTLCVGNQITLEGSGAVNYSWNYGMQNGVPYLPNIGETQFVVIGSTNAGCIGSDTVIVTVITDCLDEEEVIFWVPNTFTPDNDEYNQSFQAVFYSGYDPFSFEMDIFNRWGELVWESHDVTVGWDGTYNNGMKVPDGVYTWKIKFKRKQNDKKLTSVGHVTVLR